MAAGSNLKIKKNIYLVGFMAAGKSTVGEIVAEKLHRNFYDTDEIVESRAGQTVTQVFKVRGEAGFRDLESEAIKSVANEGDAVIALGGGALLRPANRRIIRASGISIYLRWEIGSLLDRLMNGKGRPLVDNQPQGTRENILKLYESRVGLYNRADQKIDCTEVQSPTEIANEIITRLSETE